VQLVCPVNGSYEPGLHKEHAVDPLPSSKDPAAQGVHTDVPGEAAYEPGEQLKH
jgi:hypothetical protein